MYFSSADNAFYFQNIKMNDGPVLNIPVLGTITGMTPTSYVNYRSYEFTFGQSYGVLANIQAGSMTANNVTLTTITPWSCADMNVKILKINNRVSITENLAANYNFRFPNTLANGLLVYGSDYTFTRIIAVQTWNCMTSNITTMTASYLNGRHIETIYNDALFFQTNSGAYNASPTITYKTGILSFVIVDPFRYAIMAGGTVQITFSANVFISRTAGSGITRIEFMLPINCSSYSLGAGYCLLVSRARWRPDITNSYYSIMPTRSTSTVMTSNKYSIEFADLPPYAPNASQTELMSFIIYYNPYYF
jgi:hypothetical protein